MFLCFYVICCGRSYKLNVQDNNGSTPLHYGEYELNN